MRRLTWLLISLLIAVVACGFPSPTSVISVGCDVTELIDAINTANSTPASEQTLELATDCVYMLTSVDNSFYGYNGLPAIVSPIVIHGNNATIFRSAVGTTPYFRFFYVDSDARLTLENVRLSNGDVAGLESTLIGSEDGGAILASGELMINDSVIANNYGIEGGGIYNWNQPATITDTDFPDNEATNGGAIFNYHAPLSITDSTFSDNRAGLSGSNIGSGGAIYSYSEAAAVTLTRCELSDNQAIRYGGAIRITENSGLEINDSTLLNNTAGAWGGALSGTSGSVAVLNNATISGNQAEKGGAIESGHNGGEVTISGGTISNNTASLHGGGIYNKDIMTMTGTTLSGNHAPEGGGIHNLGPGVLTISLSNIQDNIGSQTGGGIYNLGQMTVEGSTVSGNQAPQGGGFQNLSNLSITNSTITDNTAADSGGGIYSRESGSVLTITNSTISGNTVTTIRGSAIYLAEGLLEINYSTITNNSGGSTSGAIFTIPATVTISNSIIAENPAGDCSFPAGVTINDANIDSDGSCLGFTMSVNPQLGPLDSNGGPTFTHALLPGSPAYDTALGACPATDQRGVTRPYDTACDIGSYEASLPLLTGPDIIIPNPYVLEATLCWVGPGPAYETVGSLQPGTQVEILGTGEGGGYIVVNNPRYNRPCWVKEDDIDPDGFDLSNATVHARPLLPSPIPHSDKSPQTGCWIPNLSSPDGRSCQDPCSDPDKYPEPCSN
jgi:predicted outer membrane repeat protein